MKYFLLLLSISINHMLPAQNVGIGTTTPNAAAQLHVHLGTSTTKGFLVTGAYTESSTVPDLGAGPRLMFYPGKVAFRAGYTDGISWIDANVGSYSTAMGNSTIAKGNFSTAMGHSTKATGVVSTAMGASTTASGAYSIAMGESTVASAINSTAMGYFSAASGIGATAMGSSTTASGLYSFAIGNTATASGNYSTAMGYYTEASGQYSTAMGTRVTTNYRKGAFVIGDSDPNNQGNAGAGIDDIFVARFNSGYYLYTSGVGTNIGVAMNHHGNAWLSVCDQQLKENFQPLNGEDVLKKISNIKFTSWNYKQQDPKVYRHYGIMAQDFYNAFGNDNYGTIGNDTTVNPIDMIGIDMAAIQALEKRTADLKAENETLKMQNEKLQARLQRLEDILLAK